jgi:hypothetical protein
MWAFARTVRVLVFNPFFMNIPQEHRVFPTYAGRSSHDLICQLPIQEEKHCHVEQQSGPPSAMQSSFLPASHFS